MTFSGLSKDFHWTFSEHSKGISADFLRTFSRLSQTFLRTLRVWHWLPWPCFHEFLVVRVQLDRPKLKTPSIKVRNLKNYLRVHCDSSTEAVRRIRCRAKGLRSLQHSISGQKNTHIFLNFFPSTPLLNRKPCDIDTAWYKMVYYISSLIQLTSSHCEAKLSCCEAPWLSTEDRRR